MFLGRSYPRVQGMYFRSSKTRKELFRVVGYIRLMTCTPFTWHHLACGLINSSFSPVDLLTLHTHQSLAPQLLYNKHKNGAPRLSLLMAHTPQFVSHNVLIKNGFRDPNPPQNHQLM